MSYAFISFDREIMGFTEKAAFLLRPSRQIKFSIMFACLGLFILAMALSAGLGDSWDSNFIYVQNAIFVS